MSVEDALAALKKAAEARPASCLLDNHPDAVKVLEDWAEMKRNGIAISYGELAEILTAHVTPTTTRRVRQWVETHHSGLLRRRRGAG